MTSYRHVLWMVRNIGAEVRKARYARGMTLRETAEDMGVAYTTLWRLELNKGVHGAFMVEAALTWLAKMEVEA
jgi:transcriptional regulator with XRE-family HTH domain